MLWLTLVPTCAFSPQLAHVKSQLLQDHHEHIWLLCVSKRLWKWQVPLRLWRQLLWVMRYLCNQLWKWQVQDGLLRPQRWFLCQLRFVWSWHISLRLQRPQRRVMPCVRNKVSAKLRCCYMGWFAWRTQQQQDCTCLPPTVSHRNTFSRSLVIACSNYKTTTSTSSCSACPSDCGGGRYRSGCGGSSAGTCTTCANNCGSGRYRAGCSGLSAGTCTNCGSCGPGYERTGCSYLSGGTCSSCPSG